MAKGRLVDIFASLGQLGITEQKPLSSGFAALSGLTKGLSMAGQQAQQRPLLQAQKLIAEAQMEPSESILTPEQMKQFNITPGTPFGVALQKAQTMQTFGKTEQEGRKTEAEIKSLEALTKQRGESTKLRAQEAGRASKLDTSSLQREIKDVRGQLSNLLM